MSSLRPSCEGPGGTGSVSLGKVVMPSIGRGPASRQVLPDAVGREAETGAGGIVRADCKGTETAGCLNDCFASAAVSMVVTAGLTT